MKKSVASCQLVASVIQVLEVLGQRKDLLHIYVYVCVYMCSVHGCVMCRFDA